MGSKLSSQCNSCAEQEEDVEQVECSWDEFVDSELLFDAYRNEVEQREHGEDGDEHCVVDDGWVAGKGRSDHVADETHNYGGKDKLYRH